jgi:hypothetical protein
LLTGTSSEVMHWHNTRRCPYACNSWQWATLSLVQADRKMSCTHSNAGLSPLFLRLRCRQRPTPHPRKEQLLNGPPLRKEQLLNEPPLRKEQLRNEPPLRKEQLRNEPPLRKEQLRNEPPLPATLPILLWPSTLPLTILSAEGRCSIQPGTQPAKRTKPSEVTPCVER